jgi:excisionase family DNA binding protein
MQLFFLGLRCGCLYCGGMSSSNTLTKLLSVEEVAPILGISVARAYELCRTNIVPHIRLGRQIRINPDQLNAFIDRGGKGLAGGWRKEAK